MTDGERLKIIYSALRERGYAPVNQIVGFILSGDPTYITNHNGARSLAGRINRNELLGVPATVNEFLEKTGDLRPLRGMVPNGLRQLADRLLQRQMMLLHDGPQRTARV